MKKTNKLFGIIVMIAIIGFSVVTCSAKNEGGGSGSGEAPRSSEKANPASDFKYDLTEDGQGIKITGYTGGPGRVVVPSKIEDYPVLEIGDGVFDGSTATFTAYGTRPVDIDIGSKPNERAGITDIVIPNTVRKIGSSAFANTAITRFDMPDSVTKVEFSFGNSFMFSGCKQLTEVKLSDNLEWLPPLFGFIGAPALKKINLPKNLKVMLSGYTFGGCGELVDLIIPDTLTEIEFVEFADDYDVKTKYTLSEYEKYGTARANQNTAFNGCGKLPLKTRQRLKDLGYTGEFSN